MKVSYPADIERHGFAVFEDFVDYETLDLLFQELANARIDKVGSEFWLLGLVVIGSPLASGDSFTRSEM